MKILLLSLLTVLGITSAAYGDDNTICPDRPGKASATCTVPVGHIQIETDAYNISVSTQHPGSVAFMTLDPTIKYGLTKNLDLELTIDTFNYQRSGHDPGVFGFGDTYFKTKFHFYHSGKFDATLSPFVKIPTARGSIGNHNWEGGIQVPVGYQLDDKWSLATTPEVDFVKNSADTGTHVAFQDAISVTRTITPKLSLSGELWTSQDFDKTITRQYSVDVSAAWLQTKTLQFDAGIDFGLNRNTPSVQIVIGVSKLF